MAQIKKSTAEVTNRDDRTNPVIAGDVGKGWCLATTLQQQQGRDLERTGTSYHTKLDAYTEFNTLRTYSDYTLYEIHKPTKPLKLNVKLSRRHSEKL